MNCIECGYSNERQKIITNVFGVYLCQEHKINIETILKKINLPLEIGSFYYALKKIGLKPFIGWWNGKRFVPISISRSRLNIEFYDHKAPHHHKDALNKQQNESYDHEHHFICLHIPIVFLELHLEETALMVLNLKEGLKNYI